MESELDDTVRVGLAYLRPGLHLAEAGELHATGPHHELADAARRIDLACGVQGRESLVDVRVAGDDDVDVRVVQRLPDRAHVFAAAVLSRGEERMMKVCKRAIR